MLPKIIGIELPPRSGLSGALGRKVEAAAIGAGWLSLLWFLSYGGAYIARTYGPAPADVDQPLLDLGDAHAIMADSAVVLLGSAAVVAIAEFRRRKRRRAA